jgi:hypothetical protein
MASKKKQNRGKVPDIQTLLNADDLLAVYLVAQAASTIRVDFEEILENDTPFFPVRLVFDAVPKWVLYRLLIANEFDNEAKKVAFFVMLMKAFARYELLPSLEVMNASLSYKILGVFCTYAVAALERRGGEVDEVFMAKLEDMTVDPDPETEARISATVRKYVQASPELAQPSLFEQVRFADTIRGKSVLSYV